MRRGPVQAFVRVSANSQFQIKPPKIPFLSFPPSSSLLFFFLHARISVASSSGHQTAEMGAVTLHWGLGNPTLRQRHNAKAEGRRPQHTRKYCHFWILQRTWIILNNPNTCVRSINRGYSKDWNQTWSQIEHFSCVARVLNDGPWTHQPAQFGSAWHDLTQLLFLKAYFNHICTELITVRN